MLVRRRKTHEQSGKNQRAPARKTLAEVDEEDDVKQREEERQPRIDLVDIIGEIGNQQIEDTFGVERKGKKRLANSIAQLTRQDIYDDIPPALVQGCRH